MCDVHLHCDDCVAGKHGIDFALDSGTLLGAVRDQHLIEFEFDNDILIRVEDLPKVVSLKQTFLDNYGSVVVLLVGGWVCVCGGGGGAAAGGVCVCDPC